MDSDGKTGSKKRATCFAKLLQNELNSHVASFTKHEKKKLCTLFCYKTGSNVGSPSTGYFVNP